MAAALAIAVGVWWNANTVSHLFIHRPFFRRRAANAWFAALLTVMLGIPQSLWRDRHLAHHRGVPYRFRLTREIVLQASLVASMWTTMAIAAPAFFAGTYLPGYVAGLVICAVHGHYEHAGGTTSHYGWLYNALCFNDGYHVEHHRHPSAPWAMLPEYRDASARVSVWPAPLRWFEWRSDESVRPLEARRPLEHSTAEDPGDTEEKPYALGVLPALAALERLVLRSRLLQSWVVGSHAHAFDGLLASHSPIRDVAIVGGGLFPRTALIIRRLLPDAHITIVDANREHLEIARALLHDDAVAYVHARFLNPHINLISRLRSQHPQTSSAEAADICNLHCEMLIIPLSYDGDRAAIYAHPPAPTVVVHDWIWRKRGTSRVVSPLLLKRINIIRPESRRA